jgi:hypothetical protein
MTFLGGEAGWFAPPLRGSSHLGILPRTAFARANLSWANLFASLRETVLERRRPRPFRCRPNRAATTGLRFLSFRPPRTASGAADLFWANFLASLREVAEANPWLAVKRRH